MACIWQGKIYETNERSSGLTEKNGWIPPFDGKRSCLKRIGVTTQGRRVVEVGTLLIDNDKSSVVANKVLSCFSV